MTDLPPAVAAHLAEVRRIIAKHEDEIPGLEAQLRHHQAEAQKYRLAEASVMHTVELMRCDSAEVRIAIPPEATQPKQRRDLREVVRQILRECPQLYCETIANKASEGGRLLRVTEIARALERLQQSGEASRTPEGLWSLNTTSAEAADPEPHKAGDADRA